MKKMCRDCPHHDAYWGGDKDWCLDVGMAVEELDHCPLNDYRRCPHCDGSGKVRGKVRDY